MRRKKTKFLPVMLAAILMVSNISASMTALAAVKGDEDTSVTIETEDIYDDVSEGTEVTEETETEAGTEVEAEEEAETEDETEGEAEEELTEAEEEETPEEDETEEDPEEDDEPEADEDETEADEGEFEAEDDEPEAEEKLTDSEEDETESVEADDVEDAEADEDDAEESETGEEDAADVEAEETVASADTATGTASAGAVATFGIMLLDDEEVTVTAESCGDAVKYSLDNGVLTITGEGEMWDWTSASEVPWSNSMDTITKVVIKDDVTSIGDYAFYDADNLTSVEFTDSVTSIGKYAFYSTEALASLSSLENIAQMGDYAFYQDAANVTTLAVSLDLSSLDVIPDYAFYHCQGITGVKLSQSLTRIGDHAFDRCYPISTIEFPETLEYIGDDAFWGSHLNGMEITTTVDPGAVVIDRYGTDSSDCTTETLTYTGSTVVIPDSVTYIGTGAFEYAYAEYFVIGSGVETFEGSTFASYYLEGVIVNNVKDNVTVTSQDDLYRNLFGGSQNNNVVLVFTEGDAVCMIGETGYSSIAEALKAAGTSETTITLVSDVAESIVIGNDQNITLNLNGHTLSGDGNESAEKNTNSYKAVIVNEGTLTITGDGTVDAVTNGTAAVSNDIGAICTIVSGTFTRSNEAGTYDFEKGEGNNGGNSYYTICNQGTMTIKDGTFENSGCYSSMIENGFYYGSTENPRGEIAELTIKGGSFSGGLNCVKNDQYGSLEINDGKFSNYENSENQALLMNWNEAVINGGTFSGSLYGILNMSTGILEIKDGEFSNDNWSVLENHNKAVINGGTFSGACDDMLVNIADDNASSSLTINDGEFNFSGAWDIIYIDSAYVSVTITGGTFNNAFAVPVDEYGEGTWMFYFGDDDAYDNSQNLLRIFGGTFRDSAAKAKSDVSYWVVEGCGQNNEGTVLPVEAVLIEVFDVDGSPLVGVAVQIFDEQGIVVADGITDESGIFTFALTLGSYTVQITDGEGHIFASVEQDFELTEGGASFVVEFDAVPEEFAVRIEADGIIVESDSNGRQYSGEKTYDGESITLTATAETSSNATYVWYETGSDAVRSDPVSTNAELVLGPDAGEYSYVCAVTVSYEKMSVTVSVIVNVTINKASQDISYEEATVSKSVGDEAFTNPLTETTVDADGGITYKSSDESVALVDENGKVIIVGAGTTTITATAVETINYESASASYTLTITEEKEVKKADQDIHFAKTEITYTIGDEPFTNELTGAVGEVTYTSSNGSVATVDANGKVTIVGAGTTVITATATGDEYYNAGSASYTLTVKTADVEETVPEPEEPAETEPAEPEVTEPADDESEEPAVSEPEGSAESSTSNSSSRSSSHGSSGSSSRSSSSSSSSMTQEKSGQWILEGALFTYPDGTHPSNCYLNIDGEIWAFYTNGFAVNKSHTQYYTDEAIAAAGNIPTATGTWEVCGWWYLYDDGTYPANEWAQLTYNGQTYWYYFDVDGWMVDGWLEWEGNTYYLDPVYDGFRGHMVTGWQLIDGVWYYFGSDGALFKNGVTPDGYTVDANGAWIE